MSEDWRIYYENGSFGSSDGGPKEAPGWGVQIIVQADSETGRYIESNHDFFIWREDEQLWYGVDIFGLIDYLVNVVGTVKIGRMISNQKYLEVYNESLKADIAPKSAISRFERWERKVP